jgi:O-antigen ligase
MDTIDNKDLIFHRITFAALIVLACGIFTSVSFSALSHVFLLISGTYFTKRWLLKRDLPIKKSWWALVGVMVVCWFSVLANWSEIDQPIKNIIKTKYFLVALLSYFSFGYFKRDFLNHKRTAILLKLFLFATTLATISGLVALKTGFNPIKMKDACHATRACGLYGMYMTYGYGISLFMVLMTGMLLNLKLFKKWIAPHWIIIAYGINFLGLVFSFARGAWLGFMIALPFFFLKKQPRKFFMTALIALFIFGISFISPKVRDVFLNRSVSNMQRIAFYKTALTVFKEKPLLGYGYRNFEQQVPVLKERYNIEYPERGGHAHNNVLEHLASTGLVGAIAFILFLGLWLGEAYHKSWLFAFVISFITSGMVQYTFGDGENLFLILSMFSFF